MEDVKNKLAVVFSSVATIVVGGISVVAFSRGDIGNSIIFAGLTAVGSRMTYTDIQVARAEP